MTLAQSTGSPGLEAWKAPESASTTLVVSTFWLRISRAKVSLASSVAYSSNTEPRPVPALSIMASSTV